MIHVSNKNIFDIFINKENNRSTVLVLFNLAWTHREREREGEREREREVS